MADPCGSFADCKDYSTALLDHFTVTTDSLAAQVASGELSVEGWQSAMQDALRQMNGVQVVVGAHGDAGSVHDNGWRELTAELEKQNAYLDGFAQDIAAGDMSEAAIAARAALYARSTQASFYREASPVELPANPRDGSTPCLGNCDCEWDIQMEYDDAGNPTAVLASWMLGATEQHCDVCPQRAADWSPLRIELG